MSRSSLWMVANLREPLSISRTPSRQCCWWLCDCPSFCLDFLSLASTNSTISFPWNFLTKPVFFLSRKIQPGPMVTSSMWATQITKLLLGNLLKWWQRWTSVINLFLWCPLFVYHFYPAVFAFSQVYSKVSGEPPLESPTIDVSSKEFYGEGYDDSDKRIPDMTIINKQLGIPLSLFSVLLL